ncbi:MAG: hypothetical protein KAI47_03150, partial [Deltaproteobacteria bacterium]|nr:hypothetical protein [Deltaproteobacteria bacterium]
MIATQTHAHASVCVAGLLGAVAPDARRSRVDLASMIQPGVLSSGRVSANPCRYAGGEVTEWLKVLAWKA